MISRADLERLIHRQNGDLPVLSLFLDMSVDSNNKRNHGVFLNQKRAEFAELQNTTIGTGNGEEAGYGGLFERIHDWIANNYQEANRGVVIYAEVGGDWFEALQFPISVQNRMVVSDRPMVTPLAQVLTAYEHYGVILLDREHVRILSVYLGTLLDEVEFRGDPLPTASNVKAGGYSQMRFQRRKREEMKHFFKDFSEEVDRFVNRYQPTHLVLLGTEENVGRFREYLPEHVSSKIVYTGPAPVDAPASAVMERLEPLLRAEHERHDGEVLAQVRDRAAHDYLATAGMQATLTALQEGKVDTLVVTRDGEHQGVRCTQCGFVFVQAMKRCLYDGNETLEPVDVMEEMVRLAQQQGSEIQFTEPGELGDLRGAAALLRY
ncbi:MAG TPA: VLRF1 family aeRF1-type release factor [Longimicrobium sp.]|jgi:peptide chain release factor subunit 1|uniref:VLRF1 family aeRF1-type release factor n=1 Tax=Longimicrobium sp. TaxID=2029185 RepID=UPI002ED8004A